MSRSIVIAMLFGALVGTGCKKKSESSAKQEAPKGTETKGKDTPTPAEAQKELQAGTNVDVGVKAGGIQHDEKEGAAAVMTAAKGTVEVRRVGETAWTAAKADTKLYAGDQVRTADEASATITLADESVIEVAEVSTVAIASRNGTADPGSSAAVLGGMARFTVTSRAPAEGPFRVYTSSGVIVTRGTTYGVGVAASGEARVGVESGMVDVIGLAQMDAKPVTVEKSAHVVISADGKVGSAAAWPADDWGTWRDDVEATVKLEAAMDAHAEAMADLNKALADTYAELQAQADAAATFEATAAASAEKNDPAAYTTAQMDGAATIDASFLLAARLETLTWAYASHAALATDIYVRHPAEVKAKWEVVAPQVDLAVLWPKRFEITGTAYFEPLRAQYYVHHPRGRMHAHLVGIAVPQFYASVEPKPVDPPAVRAKLKGHVWLMPEMRYTASARPVWVAMPNASWHAKIKVNAAPPRAKVAWYVRPAAPKANVLFGGKVSGNWASKLDVQAPQPRASLAAIWTIPVGTKIAISPPDLNAAATARAKVKIGANGMLVHDHRMDIKGKMQAPEVKGDIKGKMDAKVGVGVKPPDVKGKLDVGVKAGHDVKAGVSGKVGGAVNAASDMKAKAGGAASAAGDMGAKAGGTVKAGASVDVKVKTPPPPPPPSVKVEGKVKASGGIKIGN